MNVINKFIDQISSKEIGFYIDEKMVGQHEFVPGEGPEGKHTFLFNVRWGPNDLSNWIRPDSQEFLINSMVGFVNIGGMGEKIPIKGSMEIKYLDEQKIRYTFDFEYNDIQYHYIGEKINIHLFNLLTSHTTCFGTLTEKATGKLISRSVTYFRLRDTFSFLRSFRLK